MCYFYTGRTQTKAEMSKLFECTLNHLCNDFPNVLYVTFDSHHSRAPPNFVTPCLLSLQESDFVLHEAHSVLGASNRSAPRPSHLKCVANHRRRQRGQIHSPMMIAERGEETKRFKRGALKTSEEAFSLPHFVSLLQRLAG